MLHAIVELWFDVVTVKEALEFTRHLLPLRVRKGLCEGLVGLWRHVVSVAKMLHQVGFASSSDGLRVAVVFHEGLVVVLKLTVKGKSVHLNQLTTGEWKVVVSLSDVIILLLDFPLLNFLIEVEVGVLKVMHLGIVILLLPALLKFI